MTTNDTPQQKPYNALVVVPPGRWTKYIRIFTVFFQNNSVWITHLSQKLLKPHYCARFSSLPNTKGPASRLLTTQESFMRTSLHYLILGLSLLFATPSLYAEVVNINKADSETLQSHLQGIGPVKSQAIVDYRKKHGPYKSLDDLLKVEGIGSKLLEKNKNSLSLNRGASKTDKVEKSTRTKQTDKSTGAEKSPGAATSKDGAKSSDVKKSSTTKEQKSTKDYPESAESSNKKQKSSKSDAKEKKTTDKKDSSASKKPSKSEKKKKSSSSKKKSSSSKKKSTDNKTGDSKTDK